jgi:hypothetical protein
VTTPPMVEAPESPVHEPMAEPSNVANVEAPTP